MQNYVDFELSESLKEVGFDDPVMEYWYRDGEFWSEGLFNITNNYNSNYPTDKYLSRPTYYEAVNWFRERKGVYVYCNIFNKDNWIFGVKNLETLNVVFTSYSIYPYPTYHEAQLDGIKEAVNYLKKLDK